MLAITVLPPHYWMFPYQGHPPVCDSTAVCGAAVQVEFVCCSRFFKKFISFFKIIFDALVTSLLIVYKIAAEIVLLAQPKGQLGWEQEAGI